MIRTARLALAALALPLPAAAQPPAVALQPTDADSPVERLGRYLRVLSTSPRELEALTGAGRAALDVGDANAAIGFFARAEEVAPRDGRVKAGLAAALVQMEQPKEALKLFDQAVELGVPAASIAVDRGLAYDLRGDNRRAQADYALALRAGRSDEAVRRLALSQAMGGDRVAAMATLDPLLRRQDKAAWRASTFVLALTGDARGAVERVGLLVPAAQAQQIAPFLGRLAALRPSEQAQAVHFGHLPSASPARPTTALAGAATRPAAGQGLVPSGAALGATPVRTAEARMPRPPAPAIATMPARIASTVPDRVPVPAAPIRSAAVALSQASLAAAPLTVASARPSPIVAPAPGFSGLAGTVLADARPVTLAATSSQAPPISAPAPSQPTPVPPSAAPAERVVASGMAGPTVSGLPMAAAAAPTQIALVELPPSRAAVAKIAPPAPVIAQQPVTVESPRVEVERARKPAPTVRRRAARPVVEAPPAEAEPTRKGKAKAETKLAAVEPARGKAGKAKVDEAQESKSAKGKKIADAKKVVEKAKPDPKKAKAEADAKAAAAKAKKEPERYWVQVATGANKADLAKAWTRVKVANAGTMAGKTAWTTPLRFTNRVLVGPFKSADEAQGFVNANAKAGFTTSRFTSPPGQAIERVGSK